MTVPPKNGELARLLSSADGEELRARADAVRREACGPEVHVRGIIELSNVCSRDCAYCGLRRGNAGLERYVMEPDEILAVAGEAAARGVGTIVLQSGEADAMPAEKLAGIIAAIKHRHEVAVTLSVGVRPAAAYRMWREAGADRYLLKFEAASPALYARFRKDDPGERLSALEELRVLGYQVGSGSIIGLPGQTIEDRLSDLRLAARLDLDMAAFGPFVPHRRTPCGHAPPGDLRQALRFLAAARILLGPVHIPAATAFDAVAPDGRERALAWGANVIMTDLTPARLRELYDIYPGRPGGSVDADLEILRRLGRPPAAGPGHTLKARPKARRIDPATRY